MNPPTTATPEVQHELVPAVKAELIPANDTERLALHFVKSRMFPDMTSIHQAVVKIKAGEELGLGPFASIDGFDIIKGRVSPSGNLLAALIRSSAKYDFRIPKGGWTDKGCTLHFFFKKKDGSLGDFIGEASFDEADAKRANLLGGDNYRKFPKAMYFNRAMTIGQKLHCPDVTHGIKCYTPEEISNAPICAADAQASGEYIEAEVVNYPPPDDDSLRLAAVMADLQMSLENVASSVGCTADEVISARGEQARRLTALLEKRQQMRELVK